MSYHLYFIQHSINLFTFILVRFWDWTRFWYVALMVQNDVFFRMLWSFFWSFWFHVKKLSFLTNLYLILIRNISRSHFGMSQSYLTNWCVKITENIFKSGLRKTFSTYNILQCKKPYWWLIQHEEHWGSGSTLIG